jgi:hypothetical protein
MTTQAAGTTQSDAAPAGQPDATPATDAGAGAGTEGDKSPSVLGDISEGAGTSTADAAPGGESKDGKPAEGEIQITMPAGVQVDEATLGEFRAAATEAGLTSESASKLAAWQVQREAKELEAQAKAWEDQGDAWAKELAADKDYGGEKLDATVLAAKRALRRYGGEEVANELARMGLGNHPMLVKMLARVGQSMAEDDSGGGDGSSGAPVDDAQAKLRLRYPSMFNEDGSPKK